MLIDLDKQRFIDEVVIPSKQHYVTSDNFWALKDVNHHFLLTSNKYAQLSGFGSYHGLVNKTLAKNTLIPAANIKIIHEQETLVITSNLSKRTILFVEVNQVMHIFAATISPIFYAGEVVAIDKKLTPVSQHNFDLHKLEQINRVTHNKLILAKTKQEEYVIYLLILNKTQQEISKFLNVSRSRVVQIIAKLSNQLGISGCSTKLLIDQAIAYGYHRLIPPELFVLIT